MSTSSRRMAHNWSAERIVAEAETDLHLIVSWDEIGQPEEARPIVAPVAARIRENVSDIGAGHLRTRQVRVTEILSTLDRIGL